MNLSSREALRELVEPLVVGELSRYLRRLIVEEPYIRARLENPGGSILLLATSNPEQVSYGTQIGNDAHLDLIDADIVLDREFSQGERDTLIQWAAGFTSTQAAQYNQTRGPIIRKRRQRVLEKLEDRLGEAFIGGTSNRPAKGQRSPEGDQSSEAGNTGRAETETSASAGDSVERDRGETETT